MIHERISVPFMFPAMTTAVFAMTSFQYLRQVI
jgi:hypothetical protein